MTNNQADERREYVRRARASFETSYADESADWTHPAPEMSGPALGGSILIRFLAGVCVFLLFVFADVSDYSYGGISGKNITEQIRHQITSQITYKESVTNLEKYVMMLCTGNEK